MMLMSDGFGRIKRWDLNHFNDDAHAEQVHFIFTRLKSSELDGQIFPMLRLGCDKFRGKKLTGFQTW